MLCTRRFFLLLLLAGAGCAPGAGDGAEALRVEVSAEEAGALPPEGVAYPPVEPLARTEAEWRGLLAPQRFRVLREGWTEPPHSGAYVVFHERGVFTCAGCGLDLFSSQAKYGDLAGWAAFWAPVAAHHLVFYENRALGMRRIEVRCARCGGHLGFVYNDGPKPTGKRYSVNSLALGFRPVGP